MWMYVSVCVGLGVCGYVRNEGKWVGGGHSCSTIVRYITPRQRDSNTLLTLKFQLNLNVGPSPYCGVFDCDRNPSITAQAV